MKLLDGLQDYLLELVTTKTKAFLRPVVDYLRRLSIGMMIITVSAVAWGISLVFLMLTLFFSLSPYHMLTHPAFWTALSGVGIGTVLVLIGLSLVRRPR